MYSSHNCIGEWEWEWQIKTKLNNQRTNDSEYRFIKKKIDLEIRMDWQVFSDQIQDTVTVCQMFIWFSSDSFRSSYLILEMVTLSLKKYWIGTY